MKSARRVLLIVVSGPSQEREYVRTSPPLDAAYLAAAVRQEGYPVSILTICKDEKPDRKFLESISGFAPDLVGFSGNTENLLACFCLAAIIKRLRPKAHVVFGGHQASSGPELCLADPHVDSVVVGEGELTLCGLLHALAEDGGLAGVAGLVYKDAGGKVVRTAPRPLIGDLDSLPLPALDLYPPEFWLGSFEGLVMGPMLASRGCPFECTYCGGSVIYGRRVRRHSPARVVQEMKLLNQRYGIEFFNFYDNNMTLDRRYMLDLCKKMTQGGRAPFAWMGHTRADLVDPEILSAMKRAGCRIVLYGFESGSQRILDRIKKGTKVEQYKVAVDMTRQAGMKVAAAFMIGFPTETPQETQETLRLIREVKSDMSGINLVIPLMGTEMLDDALKNGRLREGMTPRDLATSNSAWEPAGRTREELLKLRDAALKDANTFLRGPSRRVLLILMSGRVAEMDQVRCLPPLDAAYLAGAARAAGHTVTILTICRDEKPGKAFLKRIASLAPDLVGMSCAIQNMDACLKLAASVKTAAPGAHLVLGGYQATVAPETCLADRNVDSVVVGEGEETLCGLLRELGDAGDLSRVAGLVYKDPRGKILRNAPRPLISDLDSLAFPALDLYPRAFWRARHGTQVMGPIMGSRGCPCECTFCGTKALWSRKVRRHSTRRIVAEMNRLNEEFQVASFCFYDDNLAQKRDHLLELCARIKADGRRQFSWMCQARADSVDLGLLQAMKAAGCQGVVYGMESGSQRVLDRVKKGMTLEQYRNAAALTRQAGLSFGAAFMFGFPGETDEDMRATLRLIEETQPDLGGVNLLVPFLGTEMFEDAMKNGTVRSGSSWVPSGRTRRELDSWKKKATRLANAKTSRRGGTE